MTLESGEITTATVTVTESYGIWLKNDNDEILVLVPELEWIPTIEDARQYARIGESLCVYILRQADDGTYLGSIKRCHPELDPWRDPTLSQGALRTGVVSRALRSSETGEIKAT